MKKLIFLSTMLIVFSVNAIAQLSLRPQAGIRFSDLSWESAHGELTSKNGLNFGIDLQIGSSFYVQPGLHFNPLKLQIKDLGDIKITKINVPVMAGFKLFEPDGGRAFGIRLFAGPNFAFSISEKVSDLISDITLDDLKKFHLGILGGVGFDLSILFVDLGYLYGLTETISPETISPRAGSGAKTNYFIANAGIRIGF